MSIDDAALMEQVNRGNHAAFEEIVRRYRGRLVRAAESKLGDRDWAEDVAQETLLAVFAARHTFNPAFSFRTWVWTILLNLCRRQWKRRARRPAEWSAPLEGTTEAVLPEPVTSETGLSRVLHRERIEQLTAQLRQLPEPQADALRLRFFGELKFTEIAEAMDCSLGTARYRVQSGLRRLAERLGSDGESH